MSFCHFVNWLSWSQSCALDQRGRKESRVICSRNQFMVNACLWSPTLPPLGYTFCLETQLLLWGKITMRQLWYMNAMAERGQIHHGASKKGLIENSGWCINAPSPERMHIIWHCSGNCGTHKDTTEKCGNRHFTEKMHGIHTNKLRHM